MSCASAGALPENRKTPGSSGFGRGVYGPNRCTSLLLRMLCFAGRRRERVEMASSGGFVKVT